MWARLSPQYSCRPSGPTPHRAARGLLRAETQKQCRPARQPGRYTCGSPQAARQADRSRGRASLTSREKDRQTDRSRGRVSLTSREDRQV